MTDGTGQPPLADVPREQLVTAVRIYGVALEVIRLTDALEHDTHRGCPGAVARAALKAGRGLLETPVP